MDCTRLDAAPADWTDLLDADPAADAWHCPFWIEAVARHRPGTRPLWLVVRDGGRLVAGLAALETPGATGRLDSGPDGTAGGPVVRADLPADQAMAAARLLVDALLERRGGALRGCGISLNPGHEQRWSSLLAGDARFRRRDVASAVLDLEGGAEAAGARFNKAKRNERSRGLRRGVVAEVSTCAADLEAWHALHAQAAAHWGVAPLPLGLVRELVDHRPGADGAGAFFTCVRLEGQVVGGHLNLHRGPWVTAWSGVTDPALARTHFPSTVAVWGDVEEACRRGARWLDLGASGGIDSLSEFKRSLGARMLPRGWYLAESLPRRALRRVLGQGGAARGGARWHDGPGSRP
ncbi:MAG TPA: GNAT family N-acetyltransferase [Thauera sp.]|nr:GNAT family N-acetyltransferase [Thauera sp.]